MTSLIGNIFRVTGHLCGEFTGPGEFPTQRPVTRSFDVFFDLGLNKRLSKQPWGWWFETPSWSLWPQCNVCDDKYMVVRVVRGRGWITGSYQPIGPMPARSNGFEWLDNWPISQNPTMQMTHIPQCTIQNRNVHISVLNGQLCDMARALLDWWIGQNGFEGHDNYHRSKHHKISHRDLWWRFGRLQIRAALEAIVKMSLMPSRVLAEHWKKAWAFILSARVSPSANVTTFCFWASSFFCMVMSFIKSFFNATSRIGTPEQKCLISGIHFWVTFTKLSGLSTEYAIMMTSLSGYERGRKRS